MKRPFRMGERQERIPLFRPLDYRNIRKFWDDYLKKNTHWLIVIFLLITGPTASHAVANAALVSGSRPKDTVEDVTEEKSPAKPKARKSARKKKG